MIRKRIVVYILIIGLLLAGQLVAGGMVVMAFQKPLSPALSMDVSTLTVTPQNEIEESGTTKVPGIDTEMETPIPTTPSKPTSTPKPKSVFSNGDSVCGLNQNSTILVIGRDANIWEEPYGADAIRIVKTDIQNEKVIIFSFPRDLVVSTNFLDGPYGIAEQELGALYFTVLSENIENPDADFLATNAVAQALYDNFDIEANHYITLKEDVLIKTIDTLGMIEVDVKSDFQYEDYEISAGVQELDSEMAQVFINYLPTTQEEWSRFERQNSIIQGLKKKILDPKILPKIPELYTQFKDAFITDLTVEEIVKYTCAANEIPGDRIIYRTIESNFVTINSDDSMIMNDPENTRIFVKTTLEDN